MSKLDLQRKINLPLSEGRVGGSGAILLTDLSPPAPGLGAWEATADSLSSGEAIIHAAGWIQLGRDNTKIRLDATHPDYRMWVGAVNPTDAPFRVTKEGVLEAVGAIIDIAQIAGWDVLPDRLEKNQTILSSNGWIKLGTGNNSLTLSAVDPVGNRLWVGHESPGNAPFRVKQDGSMESTKGNIAGWEIHEEWLTGIGVGGSTYLYKNGSIALGGHAPGDLLYLSATDPDYRIWAGHPNSFDAAFRVHKDGSLFATAGTVAGWDLALASLSKNNAVLHADGYLQLGTGNDIARLDAQNALWRLWIGHAVAGDAPFRVTRTGDLIANSGSISGWNINHIGITKHDGNYGIELDSTIPAIRVGNSSAPHIELNGLAGYMGSSSYFPGLVGWRITEDGDADFNNIHARGVIRTPVFLKDEVTAIGGTFLVAESDVLTRDFVTPASTGLSVTIYTSKSYFNVGDRLRIKPDETQQAWLEVTSKSVLGPNETQYGTTFRSGNASSSFIEGWAVVNYGPTNAGRVYLSSSEANAPHVSIFTHAGSPWSAITERARLGNLSGLSHLGSGLSGFGLWTDNGYFSGSINAQSGNLENLNVSGLLNMQAGGELRVGAGTPGSNFNGLRIYRTADPLYRLEGQNNGVVQFFVDNSGRLNAGNVSGNNYIRMDETGLWVFSTGAANYNSKWRNLGYGGIYNNYVGFANTPSNDPNSSGHPSMDFGIWFNSSNQTSLQTFLNGFQLAIQSGGTWHFPITASSSLVSVNKPLQVTDLIRAEANLRMYDGLIYLRGGTDTNHYIQRVSTDLTRFASWEGWEWFVTDGNTQVATLTKAGNFQYTGNLISRKASTNHTVYGFRPLSTFSRHSSLWNSSYASAQDFDVSLTDFKRDGTSTSDIPSGAVAVAMQLIFRASAVGVSARLGPNATYFYAIDAQTQVSNVFIATNGICPVDSGTIRFNTTAAVNNVYVRIWGYYI
jgi:hypothetical protein